MGRTRPVAAVLLLLLGGLPASAADEATEAFTYSLEIGPAWVRYEERGRREFAGLETEWADAALLVSQEARYRTPSRVVSLLRFSFLTSLEDTETNNVGSATTDMRIAWMFGLQPGLQYELPLPPAWRLAPEVVWDLDWYRQIRDTRVAGDVDETVFRHGPAAGFVVGYAPTDAWAVELGYRHSFLIHVHATNSFAEDLGFGSFSTDGDRDVASLRVLRRLGERWWIDVGYRFELARIDASDTEVRTTQGPAGMQSTQVQFPENEHLIHAALLSVGFRF